MKGQFGKPGHPQQQGMTIPGIGQVATSIGPGVITSQGIMTSQGLLNSQGELVYGPVTSQMAATQQMLSTGLIGNHSGSQGQLHNTGMFFQQMTPAQQLQLQQMQMQHQAQHMKKMRGRDQAALMQQQAQLQQLQQQGKISPIPLRKDMMGGGAMNVLHQMQGAQQHLMNKMGGRVSSSVPTAALLQQSTIATSDGKQRMLMMPLPGETPISSLQR